MEHPDNEGKEEEKELGPDYELPHEGWVKIPFLPFLYYEKDEENPVTPLRIGLAVIWILFLGWLLKSACHNVFKS